MFLAEFWNTRRKQAVMIIAERHKLKNRKHAGDLFIHAVIDIDEVEAD
jgi:hypothetical protein